MREAWVWAVVACSAAAHGQGVRHVRVEGEIDCARFAGEIGRALVEADARGPSLVLLELNGNSARLDLVREIAATLRSLEAPVAVWLVDDEDGKVGVGQLVLGLQVGGVFVAPGTRAVNGADLGGLAPAGTDWEQVGRELAAPIWLRLHEGNEALAPLARGLVFGEATRVVRGTRGGVASMDARDWVDGDGLIVVDDGGRVELGSDVLVELGLARVAARAHEIARDVAGVRGVGRAEVLRSGLAGAHEASARAVGGLDELLGKIEAALEVDADGRSRRSAELAAIRRARPLVRTAIEAIGDLEARLRDYPEVLALPLDVGVTASEAGAAANARAWAKALEDIHERFGQLRAQYEALGG